MKFAQVLDLRETRAWRNHNAVIVYYYVAIAADYKTHTLRRSLRNMAKDMRISSAAVRYALQVLEREQLLEVYTTDRETTIIVAQKIVNQAQPITRPADVLAAHHEELEHALHLTLYQLKHYVARFLEIQQVAGKTWVDEKDLVSHFTYWQLKQVSVTNKEKQMHYQMYGNNE